MKAALLFFVAFCFGSVASAAAGDFTDTLRRQSSFPVAKRRQLSISTNEVKPTYSQQYNRQWTWPGMSEASLRQHLIQHANHRIPMGVVNKANFAELQALHNSDHDGIPDANTTPRVRTTTPVVRSNCPGGICPSPTSNYARPRLLNRLR